MYWSKIRSLDLKVSDLKLPSSFMWQCSLVLFIRSPFLVIPVIEDFYLKLYLVFRKFQINVTRLDPPPPVCPLSILVSRVEFDEAWQWVSISKRWVELEFIFTQRPKREAFEYPEVGRELRLGINHFPLFWQWSQKWSLLVNYRTPVEDVVV